MITQARLKELLHYDPDTGIFVWLPIGRHKASGMPAGNHQTNADGKTYIRITVDCVKHYAHRLAWLYEEGEFPRYQVDHSDGDGTNNRKLNLSEATPTQNQRNRRKASNNTSGVTGVSKSRAVWVASISVRSNQIKLGRYSDKFDAICARKSAENQYDFHSNHGSTRPL